MTATEYGALRVMKTFGNWFEERHDYKIVNAIKTIVLHTLNG